MSRAEVHVFFLNEPTVIQRQPKCSCGSTEMLTREEAEARQRDDLIYLGDIKKRIADANLAVNHGITLSAFRSIVQIEQEFYVKRLFEIFDVSSRGFLTTEQITTRFSELLGACFCRKMKLLFDIYDADGNGGIDRAELSAIVSQSIVANRLSFGDDQIAHLVEILFTKLDANRNGLISFTELKDHLDSNPELRKAFDISIVAFLKMQRQENSRDVSNGNTLNKIIPYICQSSYIRRHPREFVWAWLYLVSLVIFYVYGFVAALTTKRGIIQHSCLCSFATAKGFGKLLNWTSTLAVVFMLKDTLTFLRNRPVGKYLPIDSSVYIHKVNGVIIVICISAHVCMHFVTYACRRRFFQRSSSFRNDTDLLVMPTADDYSLFAPSWETICGWICLVAACVIALGSVRMVRRSGHFQIFFYSHLIGYVVFYICLLIHTQQHTFWIYFAIPGTIFVLEKSCLFFSSCLRSRNKIVVQKAIQWPSGVTMLRFDRPSSFCYEPGDYILLKVPDLAWFEWHPFTLTSCPEDIDYLTVHIRSAGDWTRRLFDLFHKRSIESSNQSDCQTSRKLNRRRTRLSILHKKRKSLKGRVLKSTDIKVQIRGPYGTPTGRIFQAQHVVLICAGIGVTPFASILQSIVAQHRAFIIQSGQSHELASPRKLINLTKVDFIWVVRDQRNLEWFIELLEELDVEQHDEERFRKLLNIQIYLTSATRMTDLNSFALNSALDTFYETYDRDLITGIGARARPGRPNWDKIFGLLKENQTSEVSVFYCGPPQLGRELRQQSQTHNFRFYKESF